MLILVRMGAYGVCVCRVYLVCSCIWHQCVDMNMSTRALSTCMDFDV